MSAKPKPIKVLHICQRDEPATGGAVRVGVEYVKRLPKHNIDAHCLFLYGKPGHFQTELGERAHYLDIESSREFWKFNRLPQFIKQFKPDIIHHHEGLLWSQLLTFFHAGTVKVVHAHLGAGEKTLLAKSTLASWLQRESTDCLICITEDVCQSHVKYGKYLFERTTVIYNGINLNYFVPPTVEEKTEARRYFNVPDGAVVIGLVGRLHCAMKGTDDFLQVISLLPPKFWGLVVGSGPDINYLKELAVQLGIDNRVVFTGILNETLIAYHAMDILCLTSHWEPFGLVVAEAMACGIPVVGLRCSGGVNEILTLNTGFSLPDRNLKKMAEVLVELAESSETSEQRVIEAQLQLKQNFDIEQNTLKLAELYTQLVPLHL